MQRTTMMMMSQKTAGQQARRGGGMLACLLLMSCISTASAFTTPTITSTSRMQHNTNTNYAANKFHRVSRCYGRKDQYYDDDEDEDYYDDDEDDDYNRRRRNNKDDLGRGKQSSGLNLPSSFGRRDGWRLPDSVTKSLLAGVFILGVGLGVTVDSQVNTNPKDLASRDAIDQAAPNKNLCAQFGASAMAFDQRVFVSFNPFNVYVSQADVKPACVLRDANVVPTLKTRGLINDDEVRSWYVIFVHMYWMHAFVCCVCRIVPCEKGVLYHKAYKDIHGIAEFLVVVSTVYLFTVSKLCPWLFSLQQAKYEYLGLCWGFGGQAPIELRVQKSRRTERVPLQPKGWYW
jgi:hypothetical protein